MATVETLREHGNREGKEKGYGGCYHCGDTWNWKKPHYIKSPWARLHGGAFPYCEECSQKLSRERKMWVMLKLGIDWIRCDIAAGMPKYIPSSVIDMFRSILFILLGG